MSSSIRLGKIFGIPITINYTWFVIVVLLTVQFATQSFPLDVRGAPRLAYWAFGLLTAVLLFVSVLLHELAHSLISRARGTPVEGITLFIFGGVSSISEESRRPQDELVMAAAGPFTSLVIAGLCYVLSRLAAAGGFPRSMLTNLAITNLGLAIFNMIPGFPLDGGRVLRSLLWWATSDMRLATRVASTIGRLVAIAMIVGGILLTLFGGGLTGLWLVVIGWFLENAANQSYQQLILREALAGVKARDLMTADCARIEDNPSLSTLVDEHILREGRRCIIVTHGDQLAGMITLHSIKAVPRDAWPVTSAAQAMIPVAELKTVDADASALDVLRLLDQSNINQIPVLEAGRLAGMISREQIVRFIRMKAELGL
jgi:Zn-dependent protease